MSQPTINDINPQVTLTRSDAITLLLASIAMEDLGLAHILNTEGEKVQYALGTLPGLVEPATLEDILAVNESLQNTLSLAVKKEILLDSKLDRVIQLSRENETNGPAIGEEGFAASANAVVLTSGGQLTSWNVNSPYYGNPNFDPSTGIFTVPRTGRYHIAATINYQTTASVSVELGAGVNPAFTVRNISTSQDLLSGLFPILNTSLVLLTVRVILGSGTVTIAGDVELTEGDQIGLFYVDSGLNVSLNLGGTTTPITWSIHRIA